MRLPAALLVLLSIASCGGGERRKAAEAPLGRPAAPAAAGTLGRVPDGPAARRRLGYVNPTRLAATALPRDRIVTAVVRAGAARGAIRVGERVIHPPRALPAHSVLADDAIGTAQSCLGDALAQTILGPAAMGRDAALAVGITADAPRLRLRVCGAPHLRRDLRPLGAALERRLGATVAEIEFGERPAISGTVDLASLAPARVMRLLAGGPALRALAWR